MSHVITQTQDDFSSFSPSFNSSNTHQSCRLGSMEHCDLCMIDPGENSFSNDRLGIFACFETAKIIHHLVVHSTYSKKLKTYFGKHGCIFKHDAAEIIRDMVVRHVRSSDLGASFDSANPDPDVMKEYRSGMVSVCSVLPCSHELELGSRTPHYNWAFGVLVYTLMCGPPPNNGCKKHIEFFNNIGLGVTTVQSEWFGSTGKRRKWSHMDYESKHFILKLIHTESNFYLDAFSNDLEWSEFFQNIPDCNSISCNLIAIQCCLFTNPSLFKQPCPETGKFRQVQKKKFINCKTPPCGKRNSTVTVCSHQRKLPRSGSKGKRKEVDVKGVRAMDVASFRETLRIQRLDNEKLSQNGKNSGQHNQETVEEWNGFWSRAVKMQSKKRKRSLTVAELKARRKRKANSVTPQRIEHTS